MEDNCSIFKRAGYAFPGGDWPSWAYMDMWAPELHLVSGTFTLYFTGRMKATKKLCLGVATAKDSGDPFSSYQDLGHPLLQHQEGVIDPHFHRSNGTNYLLWKSDENAKGGMSAIYIRELRDDGLSFKEGTEVRVLLRADLPEVLLPSATTPARSTVSWRGPGWSPGTPASSCFTPPAEASLSLVTVSGRRGRTACWGPTPRGDR